MLLNLQKLCVIKNKRRLVVLKRHGHTRFVQKVAGLTTVHEVGTAYGVLTPIVFNIVPFRSYRLPPTLLPLFETFCQLLFRDV